MQGERGHTAEFWPLGIILVVPTYPPQDGGAEIHAAQLAAALAARGHMVTVLTTASPRACETNAGSHGFDLVELAGCDQQRWYAMKCGWTIFRLRKSAGVVQFFLTGLHTFFGVLVAAAVRLPVMMMPGGMGELQSLRQPWLRRCELFVLRTLAHRMVVLNSAMRQELVGLGFAPERIIRLTCGVDPAFFAPPASEARAALRRKWAIPGDRLVASMACRLVAVKNVGVAIEALERLRDTEPLALLVVAGDGPERSRLDEQVNRLGLADTVRFVGRQDREGVAEILGLSEVYLLPSLSEGIPLAVMEAMAVGLPCIVSDIAGTEALITDGVEGYRVGPLDADALAGSLVRLLKDAALRRRMGEAARRKILQEYTLEAIAVGHEQEYRKLLRPL
jgi:glycosyltransferase involved in cell wall biosynthesis